MPADHDSAGTFEAHRRHLFGLAYRMLGSAADAEDVLQEAFLRWDATDRTAVASPAAWLTRVVTNLCLTELTSARQRRERYTGTWLPEPVLPAARLPPAMSGAAGTA
jgi:DNA-directed RNA polymerase specialized sigma24 family protein